MIFLDQHLEPFTLLLVSLLRNEIQKFFLIESLSEAFRIETVRIEA